MVHHQMHGVHLEQRDGTKIKILLKCKKHTLAFFVSNSSYKIMINEELHKKIVLYK